MISAALRRVHIDIAKGHASASLSLQYTRPETAKVCRKLMREHALRARSATKIGAVWYTPRPIVVGRTVLADGVLAPAGKALR